MAQGGQHIRQTQLVFHEACIGAPAVIRCISNTHTHSHIYQDEDNLREALRYCSAMLGELRTSLLGPQKYYELYMQAFDELRHIEVCMHECSKNFRVVH